MVPALTTPGTSQLSSTCVACTASRMGDEMQKPLASNPSPALVLKSFPGLGGERRAGEGEGKRRGERHLRIDLTI